MGCGASSNTSDDDRPSSDGLQQGGHRSSRSPHHHHGAATDQTSATTVPGERACITATREYLQRTGQLDRYISGSTSPSPVAINNNANATNQKIASDGPPLIQVDSRDIVGGEEDASFGPSVDDDARSGRTPDATTRTLAPADLADKHSEVDSLTDGGGGGGAHDTSAVSPKTPKVLSSDLLRRKESDMPGAPHRSRSALLPSGPSTPKQQEH